MKDRTLRGIYFLFLVMAAIILAISFAAVRTINHAVVSSDWVNQTHGTIYELNAVLSGLQAGEGMLRTYALTQDDEDHEECLVNLEEVREHLVVAKAFFRADPAALAELEHLDQTAAARLDLARQARQLVQESRGGELKALLAAPGNDAVREFRRVVTRLRNRQFELLSERDRESYRQAQTTRWVVGLGVGGNLLLLGAVAWLIRDTLATRRRLAQTLQDANTELERKVAERTAELAATNRRLSTENLQHKWTAVSQEHQIRYSQAVIGVVSDLVFVLSKVLHIGRVNPAVVHATGRREEELLGQPVTQFLLLGAVDGSVPPIDPLLQAMEDGRELAQRPGRILTNKGVARAGVFTLVPLLDNNKVVGGVLIFRLSPPA